MNPHTNKEPDDSILNDLKKMSDAEASTDSQKTSSTEAFSSNLSPPSTQKIDLSSVENRYTVLKTLGIGGMGMVQLVQDSHLGRQVALKTIKNRNFGGKSTSRQQVMGWRLKREAEITAILEHPNIIPLYDMQKEKEGDIYFTMRKVEGENFADILKKKRLGTSLLDQDDLLTIFNKICDAVAYAHSKQIIHRDLKPDNVMIGPFGEVYVLDWGIAKHILEDSIETAPIDPKRLEVIQEARTQVETVSPNKNEFFKTIGGMGTQGYMAPEQSINASQVREQADIYALGKILKQCFIYLSPLEEFDEKLKIHQLSLTSSKSTEGEQTLSSKALHSKIPEDISAIIQKATDEDWKKRYASVKALAADVERYRKNLRVSVRQYPIYQLLWKWINRNKSKVLFGITFLILCLLFLLSFWRYLEHDREKKFKGKLELALQENRNYSESIEVEQKLTHLMKALNSINEALSLKPENSEAEKTKLQLSENVVNLACTLQNYHFATYVANEVQNRSNNLFKNNLILQIEKEKTKTLREHQTRFNYWKIALQDPTEGMKEEALLEISKMNEPEIFEVLAQVVNEGTEYFLKSEERNAKRNEYYGTMATALGALGNPQAGKILWRHLDTMAQQMSRFPENERSTSDLSYMIALAEALKNSKSVHYSEKMMGLISSLGENSFFGRRSEGILKKLLLIDNLALEIQPASPEEYCYRAHIKKNINDLQGALEDYTEALRLNPQYPEAFTGQADIFYAQGNWDAAILYYTKAIQFNYQEEYSLNNRGNSKEKKEDFTGAIADYTEAIQRNPEFAEAYSNRGTAKAKLGLLEESIQDYTEAIRLDPQDFVTYSNRGNAKDLLEDLDGAIEDFTQAIHLNSKDTGAYNNRGITKERKGDINGALDDFTKAIHLDPQDPFNYTNRGLLKQKIGDFAGALEDHTEAIRINPNFYYARNNRGTVKEDLEDIDGAINDYTKALEQNPQYAEAYCNRGNINIRLSRIKEGFDDLKKAEEFSHGELLSNILSIFENFEPIYVEHQELSIALQLFQKRLEINADARFSEELSEAIFQRMITAYRKENYADSKADLDLFERYASPAHPKYPQIPQLRESLEKIKPH